MKRFKEKVALVTGAGGRNGLGRAIANRLAKNGACLSISDKDEEPGGEWRGLPAVVDELQDRGVRAMARACDITSARQVQALVDATLERFGRIDILVNNAGAPAGRDRVPVVELGEAAFQTVMDVNVRGTFLVSRAVARHMSERGGPGNIINMSSLSGRRGKARYAAYCASKFAIIGLTQSMAAELGHLGIRVNALCPALIDNDRVHDMAKSLKPEGVTTAEFHRRIVDHVSSGNPLRRLGTVEDVANAVAWLASDQSAYVTGQALNITGGDEFK